MTPRTLCRTECRAHGRCVVPNYTIPILLELLGDALPKVLGAMDDMVDGMGGSNSNCCGDNSRGSGG